MRAFGRRKHRIYVNSTLRILSIPSRPDISQIDRRYGFSISPQRKFPRIPESVGSGKKDDTIIDLGHLVGNHVASGICDGSSDEIFPWLFEKLSPGLSTMFFQNEGTSTALWRTIPGFGRWIAASSPLSLCTGPSLVYTVNHDWAGIGEGAVKVTVGSTQPSRRG